MSEPPELPNQPQQQQPYVQQQNPHPDQSIGQDAGMRVLLPVGRSGWAIAAGYLALFSVLIVPGPLALICGILGVVDIKKSAGTEKPKHGMGRALFGVIAGAIATIALVIFAISLIFTA